MTQLGGHQPDGQGESLGSSYRTLRAAEGDGDGEPPQVREKPRRRRTRRRSRNRRGLTPEQMKALPPAERWQRYVQGLPEASRTFLDLLERKGSLTVDEAVEALGLDNPKAMGGLTGAMVRWAPKNGVDLPFEAQLDGDGQRFWRWIGIPGVTSTPNMEN